MLKEIEDLRLDLIKRIVCQFYKIDVVNLNLKIRKPEIIEPRQVYHYLGSKLTECSLSKIGKPYAHSTVIYSMKTVENRIDIEREFKHFIYVLEFRIKNIDKKEYHFDCINFLSFRNKIIEDILGTKNKVELKNILENVVY